MIAVVGTATIHARAVRVPDDRHEVLLWRTAGFADSHQRHRVYPGIRVTPVGLEPRR